MTQELTYKDSYSAIEAFYNEDPRRRRSREADYGVHWTDGVSRRTWRVSYIEDTGEIYAICYNPPVPPVRVLGAFPPDPVGEDGDEEPRRGWEPRRVRTFYASLDAHLSDWWDHCNWKEDGLTWLQERLCSGGAREVVTSQEPGKGA